MKLSVIHASRTLIFATVTGVVALVGACAASPSGRQQSPPPRANLNAGIQALEAQDYAKAVQQLEIAIVADPKDPDGYYHLGQSHRGLGDYRSALKYIRLALQIEPNHFPALRERGETLLDAGKPDAARETLERLGAKCERVCPEYESLKQSVESFPSKSGG